MNHINKLNQTIFDNLYNEKERAIVSYIAWKQLLELMTPELATKQYLTWNKNRKITFLTSIRCSP